MITREESTKIVNLMTSGAEILVLGHDHVSHVVKMYYFFKYLLLYTQAKITLTESIVRMNKEGSTYIVN